MKAIVRGISKKNRLPFFGCYFVGTTFLAQSISLGQRNNKTGKSLAV